MNLLGISTHGVRRVRRGVAAAVIIPALVGGVGVATATAEPAPGVAAPAADRCHTFVPGADLHDCNLDYAKLDGANLRSAVAAVDPSAPASSLYAGSSFMPLTVANKALLARAVVTRTYPINRFLVATATAPDEPVSTIDELGDWTFVFSAESDRPTTVFVTVDSHGHVSPLDIHFTPYGGAAPLKFEDLKTFRALTPDAAVDLLRGAGIDTKFKAIKFNRLLNGQNAGPRYDFDDGHGVFASIDAITHEVLLY